MVVARCFHAVLATEAPAQLSVEDLAVALHPESLALEPTFVAWEIQRLPAVQSVADEANSSTPTRVFCSRTLSFPLPPSALPLNPLLPSLCPLCTSWGAENEGRRTGAGGKAVNTRVDVEE